MLQKLATVIVCLAMATAAFAQLTPEQKKEAVRARVEKEKADKEAKKKAKQDDKDRPQREAAAKAAADEEAEREKIRTEILEKGKKWDADQAALPADERPYEIKGDRLGMPLSYFKVKHRRSVMGDTKLAPFCSDANPDFENPFLLYKPEMAKAGIVCGTTHFPFEENQNPPSFPTIGGVKADFFVYQFVDNRLYEILITIDHKNYGKVISGVKEKYGEPSTSRTETYQNGFGAKFDGEILTWANSVSDITVLERAAKLDTSLLQFRHRKFEELASARLKDKTAKPADDL